MFTAHARLKSVVGYTTQGIAGGKLNCVALQFADVGGSGDVASISNLVTSGLSAGVYDTMNTDAPCIMIYDGIGGYNYLYYISDAYDADGNETDANVPYNVTAQTAGVKLDNEYVTVTAIQGANTFANIYLKKPCVAYYQDAAINTAAGFQTAQTKMDLYAGATLTKYNSWTVAHLFFYE